MVTKQITDVFYDKFANITRFKAWRKYLRWAYNKTLEDTKSVNVVSISKRVNPKCLLCGVSGEVTAEEYIDFTIKTNPSSYINIIDLGNPQIQSVQNLVAKKYPKDRIIVKNANALNLNFIKNHSIDWIDTDGFLAYFDDTMLLRLVIEWKRILKKDGYITFRECSGEGIIGIVINKTRLSIGNRWMPRILHEHTTKKIRTIFENEGFTLITKPTFIPTVDRFLIYNS